MPVQLMEEWPEQFYRALKGTQVGIDLAVDALRLSEEEAEQLYLTGRFTVEQWRLISSTFNKRLGTKKYAGGIVPVMNTLRARSASSA